ncbi:MAG: threonine ammonia-lyase [Phycisphaerae bacterium]
MPPSSTPLEVPPQAIVQPGEVAAARDRIAGRVLLTPSPASPALSDATGFRVFCKLEYLQRTGSFKERGAANALLCLDAAQQRRGVVAASAGNHAAALAYHGRRLGVGVTVVMPTYAPLVKVETCRRLGARVVQHGGTFAEARTRADELVAEEGLRYVHGFDDRDVIAGQGTLGLEILEQVPDMAAIVVPAGGCGLLAGLAVAVKAVRPAVRVVAVEAANCPSLTAALAAGTPVAAPGRPTLADGLAVGRIGDLAFATSRPFIDQVVTVDEATLARAILMLLETEKAVVEGAGAAPLAALLSGELADLAGQCIGLPLCGGNIDPLVLRRVIEHGLAASGRLCRLAVTVSDRPGGLARLTRLVADEGASVQDIRHERMFAGPDVANVQVVVVLETRNAEHARDVTAAVTAQFGQGVRRLDEAASS